jgi:hypothetical protein
LQFAFQVAEESQEIVLVEVHLGRALQWEKKPSVKTVARWIYNPGKPKEWQVKVRKAFLDTLHSAKIIHETTIDASMLLRIHSAYEKRKNLSQVSLIALIIQAPTTLIGIQHPPEKELFFLKQ